TYPSYALNLAQLGALCISNLCATKPLGRETITIFNPDVIVDQKTEDGIATMHDPNKLQEVKRFESPDNF
ncbi:hypothetical protein ABTE09_18955, partial [Acinetobacter baumannii]